MKMSFSVNASLLQPSLSCRTMLYSGLRLKSSGVFETGRPNLTEEFFGRVYKSLRCGNRNKSTRAGITMMPLGKPKVVYRTPGENSWQMVDISNALYRDGVIVVGEKITTDYCNQISATMLYLDTVDDVKKMSLYLSCPGGDVTPTLALYDTIKSLKSTVATHNMGYAFNLTGLLLAAGDKGHRTSAQHARVILRSPCGSAHGQADHVRNEANELIKISEYIVTELSNLTGQPANKIEKDLRRGKCLDAKAALDYGLIDSIVNTISISD